MKLAAHQPAYLPWLGYFHKIAVSDAFCVMDTVAFTRYDFINRNSVKTANGPLLLTVPVEHREGSWKRICDVRIAGREWQRNHWRALAQAYSRCKFYADYAGELHGILEKPHTFLVELTNELLRFFLKAMRLKSRLVMASDYCFTGTKSDLVLDMCRKLGATTILFGARGRDYADVALLQNAGLCVEFQDYAHPVYRQRFGKFIPNLSAIDLVFNEGPRSREILLGAIPAM